MGLAGVTPVLATPAAALGKPLPGRVQKQVV